MTDLKKRIITAVIGIPLILTAFYLNGTLLIIIFLLFSLLGMSELTKMLKSRNITLGIFEVLLSGLTFLGLVLLEGYDINLIWVVVTVLIIKNMVTWKSENQLSSLFAAIFGIFYTALLPAMVVRVGLYWHQEKLLLALLIAIWIVDSFAYFIGMRFGKIRNLTEISPMKSLEGFLAGLVIPFILFIVLSLIKFNYISYINLFIISFAAGVVGQVGDLAESMIKRYCNVKDSSNLLPGHGGLLDRADSLLLAGSFLYCALTIMNKM